jgi:cell division protein ZapA
MKDSSEGATVTILGKDFMVACPEAERPALFAAARLLDGKMRDIQSSGKVIGTERCAIMAALNIANELLELKARGGVASDVSDKIKFLQTKIDDALAQSQQ